MNDKLRWHRVTLTLSALVAALFPFSSKASNDTAEIATTLFHHVSDNHELEIFPYLPAIPLPFNLTVHCFMLLLASAVILVLFIPAFRKRTLKVTGVAVALEAIVLFVRDDIVYPVMGEELGEAWLPFFSTLFLFIVTINYIGLIPAFKSATGNINVTTALAIVVLLVIFVAGFKNLGFVAFFKNMYPEDTPWALGVLVTILEFFSLFIKIGVLSVRLFANMFAGHLAILSLLVLIFVLSPYFAAVSLPFAVFSYTLDILIALIQAFVFTLLSCVFITMAIKTH